MQTYKQKIYIVLAVIFLIICTFPFIYMVLHSFASWDQVDKVIFPTEYTFKSYDFLLSGGGASNIPWLRGLFNSAFVSLLTSLAALVVGMLLAYSIVKIKFKGHTVVNNIVLIQMFFPVVVILVPLYMVTRSMGMDNSYLGMIVPKAINAWAIFMYVSYFRNVPDEMLEAARIDGASELKVLTKIILPNVKSTTTILFLFMFMERWNELLWDNVVVSTNVNLKTLNVLISSVSGPYGSYPGALYAASVILTIPIILLFVLLSKKVYEGMSYVSK